MRPLGASPFLVIFTCLFAAGAHAEQPLFYFDVGGGLSQIRAAAQFFNGSATGLGSTLGMGTATHFALALNMGEKNSSAGYHIGIQGRYGTGSDTGTGLSLSLINLYPFLRLEMKGIFLSLGLSPFAWQRAQPGAGFNALSRSSGILFALVEVGFHHAITPSVSFGVVASGQFASVGGNFSYNPYLSGNAFLRFNYGRARAADAGSSNGDKLDSDGAYPGWRYPYGRSN